MKWKYTAATSTVCNFAVNSLVNMDLVTAQKERKVINKKKLHLADFFLLSN